MTAHCTTKSRRCGPASPRLLRGSAQSCAHPSPGGRQPLLAIGNSRRGAPRASCGGREAGTAGIAQGPHGRRSQPCRARRRETCSPKKQGAYVKTEARQTSRPRPECEVCRAAHLTPALLLVVHPAHSARKRARLQHEVSVGAALALLGPRPAAVVLVVTRLRLAARTGGAAARQHEPRVVLTLPLSRPPRTIHLAVRTAREVAEQTRGCLEPARGAFEPSKALCREWAEERIRH